MDKGWTKVGKEMIHLRCKRCDKGTRTVGTDSDTINKLYQNLYRIRSSTDIDEREIIEFMKTHKECPLYYLSKGDHDPIYLCEKVMQELQDTNSTGTDGNST